MAAEMPTIGTSIYSATSIGGVESLAQAGAIEKFANLKVHTPRPSLKDFILSDFPEITIDPTEEATPMTARRFVQVIVSDPHPLVPLEHCILHKGEPQVTDLTDQELYYELDIKKLVSAHNEVRTKVIDKSVKDRTEFLEPVKIRELKMTVVLIAAL